MTPATTPPRNVRLAFSSFLWRTFLLFAILAELALIGHVAGLGVARRQKLMAVVFFSPRTLFWAFLVAALAAMFADLIVRLFLRPLVNRWHAPPVDVAPATFHQDFRDPVLAQTVGRRLTGRLWRTGTLIRTERTIAFLPSAWDAEPWIVPIERVRSVETVPAPRMFRGFILGLPDRIRVVETSGEASTFAAADPDTVRKSLCPVDGGLVGWLK